MTITISILLFFTGMLLTSFYHLIAQRVPKKESILGRSYCEHCHKPLRLIDVFPLIGFLMNRGVCHTCKKKISLAYPLIEIIGGLLFVGTYLLYGFGLEFFVAIIMISVLLVESISDWLYKEVIDLVWIIGVILLIVIRIIDHQILPYFISSMILFFLMYFIALLGKAVFKKDALGGGDIKLYFFIGFCLTWQLGLLSLFVASFTGAIYGIVIKNKIGKEIALVPFIFIGVLFAYIFGNDLIHWYLNLLGM